MLKVFESFAGLGSQSIALENIGIEHEVVAISEIDKYATLSYDALHEKDIEVEEKSEEYMLEYLTNRNIGRNEKSKKCIINKKEIKPLYEASIKQNNLGDISLIGVKDIPQHDLFTYSFPCQSVSVAGKGEGLEKGTGTRSSLLWECQKVIEGCKPKYLLMENVKNLLSKKFKPFFDERCEYLENLGYANYYEVLNGKDFGIPQNRERVFMISILGEHEPYEFPTGFPLELRLKDILDETVDEKYFLPKELQDKFIPNQNFTNNSKLKNKVTELGYLKKSENGKKHQSNTVYDKNNLSRTLMAGDWKCPQMIVEYNELKPVRICGLFDTEKSRHQAASVWDKNYLAPTLDTAQSGYREPCIVETPCIAASRGRNPDNPSDRRAGIELEQRLEINKEGICNTITTVQKDNYVIVDDNIKPSVKVNFEREKYEIAKSDKEIYQCECDSGWQDNKVGIKVSPTLRAGNPHTCVYNNFRIRKLTPRECMRLMGFKDYQIDKLYSLGISDTQMYKMAGNSIIVDVLEYIFRNLFLKGEIDA